MSWSGVLVSRMSRYAVHAVVAARDVEDAVAFDGFLWPLISILRSRTYVFRSVCSVVLSVVVSTLSPPADGFWTAKALSSWDQYHSHSQSRHSFAVRLSSARVGRWRWTMLWRVSRMCVGKSKKEGWRCEGSHEGRERRSSVDVSDTPVANLDGLR